MDSLPSTLRNEVKTYEKDICSILSRLAYHIHPLIVARIQAANISDTGYFQELFGDRIDIGPYLFEGSACVFPGVHRYVRAQGSKHKYNPSYRAIIDDNQFPRHIWCFLETGNAYSGPNWKRSGLGQFELAHIFSHKDGSSEEQNWFSLINPERFSSGLFSCAANVVLLPKGMVRPTDNSPSIKAVFYQRALTLYGEAPFNGLSQFRRAEMPSWAESLEWNEPFLPPDWEKKTDKLLDYRRQRLKALMRL